MNRKEEALKRFREGFSCSQSVLSVFAPELGLEEKTALKVAGGFGGGMGRMALTCGAVTGAYMVIGLKHGSTHPAEKEAKQKTQERVRQFRAKFEERNRSCICRDLLGCDISTKEGIEEATRRGLIQTVCPKLVGDAVEILEEIL